jgi:sugar/nucleoside kinase (ribokinase family)
MNSELSHLTALGLRAYGNRPHRSTAAVGVDGFVDEIVRVVDKRTSQSEYTQIERISDFAARIAAASGHSTNIELIVEQVKLGGNGPIMANAVAALGAEVTCVGPLGAPSIHPAFAELAKRATLISLGEPGHTDAVEFGDGKLMLGKHETLVDVNWDNLIGKLGADGAAKLLTDFDLVALNNWTMLPAMNDIWSHALDILAKAPKRERLFFFDLADPEKRDDASVREACGLLSRFEQYGKTLLGLNEKEGFRIAGVLGYTGEPKGRDAVLAAAQHISAQLPISAVVVHPRAYAVAAASGKITANVDGPFTEHPKISTGAGDHFNAGFCIGKLAGLPDDQATTVGVGTSGYYVRNAASPTVTQLADFLDAQAG